MFFFKKGKKKEKLNSLCAFEGKGYSTRAAKLLLRESANLNTFIQIIGRGRLHYASEAVVSSHSNWWYDKAKYQKINPKWQRKKSYWNKQKLYL